MHLAMCRENKLGETRQQHELGGDGAGPQWAEEQPRRPAHGQNGLDFRSCRLGEDGSEPQGQVDTPPGCLSQ